MSEYKLFRYSKSLYSKMALLKSAYSYTDKAYIHLDSVDDYYVVSLTIKEGQRITYEDFENEMIAQSLRDEIYEKTKDIRKLTVARALASTIVCEHSEMETVGDESIDINDVLKSWFDK